MAERDRRFGGNMEVANTGIPYPTGGRDVRFDGSLPPQFQYRDRGRTVVSDTEPYYTDMGRNYSWAAPSSGTPNFREPFKQHPDPKGKRQRERHLQFLYGDPPYGQSDTFTNPYYPEKKHPNPRMRGMGGGLGGLQELAMADERNWDSMPDLADWKQGIGPGARKPIQTIPIFPGTFGDSLEGVINDQTLGNQWAETAENSEDYLIWKSIKRKFGEVVANQMMGYVTANRGGIIGVI